MGNLDGKDATPIGDRAEQWLRDQRGGSAGTKVFDRFLNSSEVRHPKQQPSLGNLQILEQDAGQRYLKVQWETTSGTPYLYKEEVYLDEDAKPHRERYRVWANGVLGVTELREEDGDSFFGAEHRFYPQGGEFNFSIWKQPQITFMTANYQGNALESVTLNLQPILVTSKVGAQEGTKQGPNQFIIYRTQQGEWRYNSVPPYVYANASFEARFDQDIVPAESKFLYRIHEIQGSSGNGKLEITFGEISPDSKGTTLVVDQTIDSDNWAKTLGHTEDRSWSDFTRYFPVRIK